MSVPKRFGVLRFISRFLKVVAWIILLIAIVLAIGVAVISTTGALPADMLDQLSAAGIPGGTDALLAGGGIAMGIVILLAGLIYFLLIYAAGENITLYLSIEENTRLTAALLLKMHQDDRNETMPTPYGSGYANEPGYNG